MKAYLNDPQLKKDFVAEIKKHQEADMVVQGTYGEQNGTWKGCAVACSLRSLDILKGVELREKYNQHSRYESELGIPRQLAKLEDGIFEGMNAEDAQDWPLRFAKAIKPGADLSLVVSKLMVYILKDKKDGVYKYTSTDGKRVITQIVKLYERKISGDNPTEDEWRKLADKAWRIRYDAAAAYAAAYAADAAAAYAAAYAADAYARQTHYKKMADKLIEILESEEGRDHE